jgi:hypothetical protein
LNNNQSSNSDRSSESEQQHGDDAIDANNIGADFNNTNEVNSHDGDNLSQDENNITEADEAPSLTIQEMDLRYGKRMTLHNLHPRRPQDYGHLHATLEGIMLLQHSMKKG